jgi:hypothetical protein
MNIDDVHISPDIQDNDPKKECEFVPEGIIINEVQLLLAEKRTSLSSMRTGITVIVLPLSVLSILIATSKYYDIFQVMYLFVPLLFINAALVCLGAYLIMRAVFKIRHYDGIILQLKRKHRWISEFVD